VEGAAVPGRRIGRTDADAPQQRHRDRRRAGAGDLRAPALLVSSEQRGERDRVGVEGHAALDGEGALVGVERGSYVDGETETVEQLRLAAGKSAPEDFLPLADRFAQAATSLAPDALLALDYHGRALTITLKEGTNTATLRTAARAVGLKMDSAEAPRSGETVVPGSRWTVSLAQ